MVCFDIHCLVYKNENPKLTTKYSLFVVVDVVVVVVVVVVSKSFG